MKFKIFKSILETISLYSVYSKKLAKSKFQYKFNAFFLSFVVFIREMVNVVIVYLTLTKFGNINGWNLKEMLFLFSLLFLSYSILILFFAGVRDFDMIVNNGDLDRFLVRPLGLLFQVISYKTDFFACIGHGTVGIVLFLTTASSVGIQWNAINVIYYVTALLGGVMIQASLFLISSCFSFWTLKTGNIVNFLFSNSRKFVGYPISIFPGFIQKMLIFAVPFSFVNYFPAQYFLRKPDMSMYWNGLLYLTPVVGIIMFIFVYAFWQFSLRHYSSAGN